MQVGIAVRQMRETDDVSVDVSLRIVFIDSKNVAMMPSICFAI